LDASYSPLLDEALLHISGPDSLKFLQGQTTCDTDAVDAEHALLGAYCNPQGRMSCDFLLSQLGSDHFALRMKRDIIDSSAATFGKYIIFSKAELDPANSDWQVFACWGANAREALASVFPDVPGEKLGCSSGEYFCLVQIDESGSQFECYIDTAAQSDLADQLNTALTLDSETEWQALQIESGIGRIEAATVEEFIPQMLNFDITGHVSFTKGCYTGQEVVARMHYRGKPKRRMYLSSIPGSNSPAAGTALFSSGNEQSVGNIVNCAQRDDGTALALLVATEAGIENGLHVGAADGSLLDMLDLPYSMDKP